MKIASLEIALVHARRELVIAGEQLGDREQLLARIHELEAQNERLAAAVDAALAAPEVTEADRDLAAVITFFTVRRKQGRPSVEQAAMHRRAEAAIARVRGTGAQ